MGVNIRGERELLEALTQLGSGEAATMCTKELAGRVLAKAVKKTPVGVYPKGSGMVGGSLRRAWTADVSPRVSGDIYKLDVTNPLKYASYVEYGHRQTPGRYVPAIGKRLKKSWIDGQFMLTLSVAEVERIKQRVVDSTLQKYLNGVFG